VSTYSCIVADPPWAPRDKLPGPTRGAAKQYPVMSTGDICELGSMRIIPRPDGSRRRLAHTTLVYGEEVSADAVLFLWRLASMQKDAIAVVEAWGFTVKSEVVWQKLTKRGLPWFGMGRTVRASHETCIVAVRGRASKVIRAKNIRSTFAAPVPVDSEGRYIHSAKPTEFFSQIVEPLVGDVPRLEIFARTRRPGWDAIGNQLPALEAA
jgi:N6-adenosine-specific RNA methylase IME4